MLSRLRLICVSSDHEFLLQMQFDLAQVPLRLPTSKRKPPRLPINPSKDWIMLTSLILLKSGIENLSLGLGEQQIPLLHADGQIFGRAFIGHFPEIYRASITFSIKSFSGSDHVRIVFLRT
jgi:hypothetical protein